GRGCVSLTPRGPNTARGARGAGGARGRPPPPPAPGGAGAPRAGHPVAMASFERAAKALAAGIAATATLVEIRIAVIGGGVANAGEVLFAPLRRSLQDYATLSFVQSIKIAPALTGTDAGLVGAAAAATLARRDGTTAPAVG
ncbi:ROK family protein, partial [Streptomyces sp. NPDC059396]|uniref:ROK family protein n=1 Tax=Streptomyces sp. NPDC059396 TaxID=3346819 RepID=UPI0036C0B05C